MRQTLTPPPFHLRSPYLSPYLGCYMILSIIKQNSLGTKCMPEIDDICKTASF